MNITYFQATATDIPVMVEQRIAFLLEMMGPQTAAALNELRRLLETSFSTGFQNSTYVCWLAMADGHVVGSGGMAIREQPGNFKNPSGKTGYLMSMYTIPAFRKIGICGNLVNRLVETGRAMGIHTFELHATKDGEPVYKKQGFSIHNEPSYGRDENAREN